MNPNPKIYGGVPDDNEARKVYVPEAAKKRLALSKFIEAASGANFADALLSDDPASHVVKLKHGMALATYRNASTSETVRIFVRDAGVIARDLPGTGPTKYRLTKAKAVPVDFVTCYEAGEIWGGVLREYFKPEPWEVLIWQLPAAAVESIAAGSLMLRKIGKQTCRACGTMADFNEASMISKQICTDCQRKGATDAALKELEADAERQRAARRPKRAKWNGEPAEAARGTVIVGKCPESWWCSGAVEERLKVVRVCQGDETFFIDDTDGQGTRKVFDEGGSPRSSHRSVPVDDPATFVKEDDGPPREDLQVHNPRQHRAGTKIGRNDPCPCDSGKKFKHCCDR